MCGIISTDTHYACYINGNCPYKDSNNFSVLIQDVLLQTLKENSEVLVAATREIGLEVSADKTKYMVMSRDQNAGRIHSVRIDNNTFERVEEFKFWEQI